MRKMRFKASPGIIFQETPSRKNTSQKRVGRVAQGVELLPSKGEALSSNSNTTKKEIEKRKGNWASVAHAYSSSYSGGRDQENRGSKSALGKQFKRPYLKCIQHKKGLVKWLKWLSACLAMVRP
jgi:hypothetical protein